MLAAAALFDVRFPGCVHQTAESCLWEVWLDTKFGILDSSATGVRQTVNVVYALTAERKSIPFVEASPYVTIMCQSPVILHPAEDSGAGMDYTKYFQISSEHVTNTPHSF